MRLRVAGADEQVGEGDVEEDAGGGLGGGRGHGGEVAEVAREFGLVGAVEVVDDAGAAVGVWV